MSQMSHVPQDKTPVTEVEESDPNGDGPEGLAGDMGVSSGRKGPARGQPGEVTYGSAPLGTDAEPGKDPLDNPGEDTSEVLPEQSARDGRPEVNPASLDAHESDPDSNPRHGV
jgi:hypothetical protein